MKLGVKFFARARDAAGLERAELDLPEPATVAQLRFCLGQQFPNLAPLLPSLLIAVGNNYADDTTLLSADAEVACFPPVSGG